MKRYRTVLLVGFALWLVPFIIALLISPLRQTNRVLFESFMSVVLAISVVVLAQAYFRRSSSGSVQAGAALGTVWLLMSLGLDLMLFAWGPMEMGFLEYLGDIGLTYLIYPVVTIGMGWALERGWAVDDARRRAPAAARARARELTIRL